MRALLSGFTTAGIVVGAGYLFYMYVTPLLIQYPGWGSFFVLGIVFTVLSFESGG